MSCVFQVVQSPRADIKVLSTRLIQLSVRSPSTPTQLLVQRSLLTPSGAVLGLCTKPLPTGQCANNGKLEQQKHAQAMFSFPNINVVTPAAQHIVHIPVNSTRMFILEAVYAVEYIT